MLSSIGIVATEPLCVQAQGPDGFGELSCLGDLVKAVDDKDQYTRKHSEDVMVYCAMIAAELGLDRSTQQTAALGGLLHDVGKIKIADAVLGKPGRLADDEFATVKLHPEIGAEIVSSIKGLEGISDAVRYHHERWDGQGYPSGLAGEQIPLIARLIAVADAYSAMTTDRPYRQGMEIDEACSILKDGANTQWDEKCVSAFLRAISSHA